MSDPYVREVDRIADIEEAMLVVGVDYDSVSLTFGTVGPQLRFSLDGTEELARAIASAAWEAGRNVALMQQDGIESEAGK